MPHSTATRSSHRACATRKAAAAKTSGTCCTFRTTRPSGLAKARTIPLPHALLRLQPLQVGKRRIVSLLRDLDRVLDVRTSLFRNLAEQVFKNLGMLAGGRLNAIISVLLLRWAAFEASLAERGVQAFRTAVVVGECGFEARRVTGFASLLSLFQILLVLFQLLLYLLERQSRLVIACLLPKRACGSGEQNTGNNEYAQRD